MLDPKWPVEPCIKYMYIKDMTYMIKGQRICMYIPRSPELNSTKCKWLGSRAPPGKGGAMGPPLMKQIVGLIVFGD